MVKSWLVQDQTVLGKDYSNLLIADSLLKTIWFINAPCYGNEALASPKANGFGKDKSNPLIVGSLLKTTSMYLKKKLYTYYISPCMKLDDHIDEFNKLILDLANIDIEIKDEDQALMLLTSLPSSYENFMETLLYGKESLIMEDVLATLISRELKKRTEGTKEETGDGLYARGRSDHLGKAHSGGSSWFKSRGGTSKLKCFICHSEGHLKRDCLMKKSTRFIKKSKRDQDFDSSDDEGNTYFGEALVVVKNDDMTELVIDLGVHGVQDAKRVWFEVELQGAQGDREAEVFQVSNDDAAVAQRRLGDKQPELKTNMDCLVKEQEKVHLGIKVGANITLTEVPGQEGAEGNVDEKKKVKQSMEANLGKLLKYTAWLTRWSLVRGSTMRKRC
ncbi:retrovirus-related pol polyprotein from transposon TNT 1-94 [Tanacetum coccineum]|uniref:Retrovirus-related pol polyprotein from transposon TNT 1-94 n=1 Tax=Tanacetum coccineum TaxID=301880 RepID=A0ABQ4YZW2_9ASTR